MTKHGDWHGHGMLRPLAGLLVQLGSKDSDRIVRISIVMVIV